MSQAYSVKGDARQLALPGLGAAELRRCSCCRELLPASAFYPRRPSGGHGVRGNAHRADGLREDCKACCRWQRIAGRV